MMFRIWTTIWNPMTAPQASDRGCAENPSVDSQLSNLFEGAFNNYKPGGIDEAEERGIVHLLRWFLQLKAEKRPDLENVLRHE